MKKLLSYLLVIALVLVQFTPVVSAVSAKNGKNDDFWVSKKNFHYRWTF